MIINTVKMKQIKIAQLKKAAPELNEFLQLSAEDAIDVTLPKDRLFPLIVAGINLLEPNEKSKVGENIQVLIPVVEDRATVETFLKGLTKDYLIEIATEVFELERVPRKESQIIEAILVELRFAGEAEEPEEVKEEVNEAVTPKPPKAPKQVIPVEKVVEEVQEETPYIKSKAVTLNKNGKPRKIKQGVCFHIARLVEQAPPEGISKEEIVEILQEIFPERSVGATRATVKLQVPCLLRKERFAVTEVTKGRYKKTTN